MTSKPDKLQAIHDGLGWSSTARGTGVAPRIDGRGRVGQDRHGAGDFAIRARRGPEDHRTCGITAGSSSFAPRDHPRIAGVVFAEHAHARRQRRTDRAPGDSDTFFAKEGRAGRLPPNRQAEVRADLATDGAQESRAARRAALRHMFERRLYYHIDWALVSAILALCAIGVAMIYSTTADPTRGGNPNLYRTQLYAIVIGLGAMMFMLTIDYRAFTDKSHLIYIALLRRSSTCCSSVPQMGARRWIAIGCLQSAAIGVCEGRRGPRARQVFRRESRHAAVWTDLAIGAALTCLPLALIAREPDLGTAVTLIPVFLAVAFVAGMQLRILGILAVCGPRGANRLDVCAQGLSEITNYHISRSDTGREGRRIPADPGAHHGRIGRPHG